VKTYTIRGHWLQPQSQILANLSKKEIYQKEKLNSPEFQERYVADKTDIGVTSFSPLDHS